MPEKFTFYINIAVLSASVNCANTGECIYLKPVFMKLLWLPFISRHFELCIWVEVLCSERRGLHSMFAYVILFLLPVLSFLS